MSILTVRLPDELSNEIKIRTGELHISCSEYIRKFVKNMNRLLSEQERTARFVKVSDLVRAESIRVNNDFVKIEYEPKI